MKRLFLAFLFVFASAANAQTVVSNGETASGLLTMSAGCLVGEEQGRFAPFFPRPDPAICSFEGACTDQEAANQIVVFLEACHEGLLNACLKGPDDLQCLLEELARFRGDASALRQDLGTRVAEHDLSNVPKLLMRRLGDPARLTLQHTCNVGVVRHVFDADDGVVSVFCRAQAAGAARLAMIRAHYALDKAGVPR